MACKLGGWVVLLLASLAAETTGVRAATCYRTFSKEAYPYCQLLSPTYALHWRDDVTSVEFAVDVDGTWRWLGLGIGESAGMLAADIMLVRRSSAASVEAGGPPWVAVDSYATAFAAPTPDNSSDVQLVSASSTNNATTAVFARQLDTCDDAEDRRIIRGTVQTFIFAYGAAWPAYHGPDNRGVAQMALLPLLPPAAGPAVPDAAAVRAAPVGDGPAVQEGGSTWTIRMDNVTIPAERTTYYCRHMQMPNPETKVHITDWEVLLTEPRYVHHMIVYACSSPPSPPKDLYACNMMDLDCQVNYVIWAPGGSNRTSLPAQAGLPLGGSGGYTWLALQVHYTNEGLTEGVVDSSGFVLFATPQLRPNDMGIMALGSTQLNIPPGQPAYSTPPNYCPSACMSRISQPLTVHGVAFHMHLLGRSGKVQWLRGGQERAPLAERRQYAFDYQGLLYQDVSDNVVQPGDSFLTTCTYDSTGRANRTKFGEETMDEMCMAFIYYYPLQPGMEICTSMAAPRILGGGLMGLCTSMERLRTLSRDVSSNAMAAMNLGLKMQAAGEIVATAVPQYTPFTRACEAAPRPAGLPPPLPPLPSPPPLPQADTGVDEGMSVPLQPSPLLLPAGLSGSKQRMPPPPRSRSRKPPKQRSRSRKPPSRKPQHR